MAGLVPDGGASRTEGDGRDGFTSETRKVRRSLIGQSFFLCAEQLANPGFAQDQ